MCRYFWQPQVQAEITLMPPLGTVVINKLKSMCQIGALCEFWTHWWSDFTILPIWVKDQTACAHKKVIDQCVCVFIFSPINQNRHCVYVTARRHIVNTDRQRLHCLIFHTDFLTSLLVFFANKNPESLKHLPGIVFKKHANHSEIKTFLG